MGQRDVPELLRDWADAQRPEPSSALLQMLSGATPVLGLAATPGTRTRALRRTGLTVKVALVVTALTVSSAAAVGLTQAALGGAEEHPSLPRPTSTAALDPAPEETPTTARPTAPVVVAPSASQTRPSAARPEPRRSETPEPRTSPRAQEPSESPEATRDPETPTPRPSDTSGADPSSATGSAEPSDGGPS